MKKGLLILFSALCCALTAFSAVSYQLNESFESGIPANWTQEVVSTSQCQWVVESADLTNPANAFEGSARVALRNSTGQTQDYVTRLITPVMNLSSSSVFQPILVFAHAQALRNQVFDTLKVYYRTSVTDTWHLLKSFDKGINAWQVDTIQLQAQSATYQIAFEAKENMGRGVVLDDIKVFPKSQCTGISTIIAEAMSRGANIYVTTDDEYAEVIVDTLPIAQLATYNTANAVFYAQHEDSRPIEVSGLQPRKTYYVYARTECDDNESGYTTWKNTSFKTAEGFPFVETFAGSMPSTWTNLYGAIDAAPTANTSTIYNWAYSTNTTVTGSTHVVGRPHYQYSSGAIYTPTWLVTPAIDLVSVEEEAIELSFKLSMSSSSSSASEVGDKTLYNFYVMVSVDGGENWIQLSKLEGIGLSATSSRQRINLSGYIGNSVTLAFVAEGAGTSCYFHIDDVKIDTFDPNCGGASQLKVVPSFDSALASWTISGKDSVVIQLSKTNTFATLLVNDTISAPLAQYTFSNLDNRTKYYARVCQICPDADWSVAQFATTAALPYVETFSASSMPSDWSFWSGADTSAFAGNLPRETTSSSSYWGIYAQYAFSNTNHLRGELYYGSSSYKQMWAVSPVVDMTNTLAGDSIVLSFDMAYTNQNGASASSTKYDMFRVMVSEDAGATWTAANSWLWSDNDSTAFSSMAEVTVAGESYSFDLSRFYGKKIQFAFYKDQNSSSYARNYIHIRNVKLRKVNRQCAGLSELKVTVDIEQAIIRWKVNGDHEAKVQLSSKSNCSDTITLQTISGVDSVLLIGLTPNTKYYVRAMQNCAEGEWSDILAFQTHCNADTIPYVMDFESAPTTADPACWTIVRSQGSYPKVASNASYAKNGSKYLNYGTSGSDTYNSIVCLPAFEKNANQLEMSLWIKAYSSSCKHELQVGVMSDPLDTNTFVRVTSIMPTATVYEQYFISFASYTGNGKYIALKDITNGSYYHFYVDSIAVYDLPSCYRMGDVIVNTITAQGATLKFDRTNADDYQIVVATSAINPDSAATSEANKVVYNQIVSNPAATGVVLSDASIFTPNTSYNVYVRGICSAEEKGVWSMATQFTTLCAPFTPAEFGIEEFSNVQDMACWTFGFATVPASASTSYSYATRTTDAVYGAYLKLSKESANSTSYAYRDGAYAITPELNIDSINHYQVTFTAATTKSTEATNQKKLIISIVTNPSDLDTKTEIKTINLSYASDSTMEKSYTVSFRSYEGDYNEDFGRYVMFQSVAGDDSTNYVLVDNVSFQQLTSCPAPEDMKTDSIHARSVGLSWTGDASQYEIYASLSKVNMDTILTPASQTTANNNILLAVEPNNTYYIYMRALCDGNEKSNWIGPEIVTTPCAISSYPIVYNFDNIADQHNIYRSYRMENCWNAMYTSTSYLPQIVNDTTVYSSNYQYAYSGTMALQLQAYSASNALAVVMPELEGSLDTLQLTFMGRAAYQYGSSLSGGTSSYDRTLLVGYMDDPNDMATFHTLDSIVAPVSSGTDPESNNWWRKYTISLKPAKSQYIAFKVASYTYFYIDDVTIEALPKCPIPSKASVVKAGTNSATIAWNTMVENHVVKVLVENEVIAEYASAKDTFEVTNLLPGSTYAVRIYGLCDGDTTEEYTSAEFTTNFGLPFSENFSTVSAGNLPAGWTLKNGNVLSAFSGTAPANKSIGTYDWKVSTSGISDKHLWINIYSGTANDWAVSPLIDLTACQAGDDIEFTFDAAYTNSSGGAVTGTTNHALLLLVSTDGGASWNKTNSWEWANYTDSTAAVLNASLTKSYQTITLDFSRFAGQNIQFAFVGINGSGDQYFHVDNISLKKIDASCVTPESLSVDTVMLNSAILSWVADAAKTTIVEIATSNDFRKGLMIDTVMAGLTDTINGLIPATKYFVRIKQLCSSSSTEYSATATFSTLCDVIKNLPWVEGFENMETGSQKSPAPMCWDILKANNGATPYIYVNTTAKYVQTGSKSLNFVSSGTIDGYAILPVFDTTLNVLQLSFSYIDESAAKSGTFAVGYITDETADSTFVLVSEFTPSVTWQSVDVDFSGIDAQVAQNARMAIRYTHATNNYYAGIDDIKVSFIPSCKKLKTVIIDSITSQSALLKVMSTGAEQYQMVVTNQTINPDTLAQVAPEVVALNVTSEDTMAVVTTLEANTNYYVYARSLCSGSNSEWITSMFKTECSALTITAAAPFAENFDQVADSMPDCWTVNRGGGKFPYVYNYSTYAHSGMKSLYFGGYSGVNKTAYVVLPEVTNDVQKLQMSFYLAGYSSTQSNNDSIVVGVMSNPNDANTFVRVAKFQATNSSYALCELNFEQYQGTGKYIAIKRCPVYYYYSYYGSYIDDITLSLTPTCPPIVSIEAQNITRREMDITWTAKKQVGGMDFELVLADSVVADSVLATCPKIIVNDTNVYHATGLIRGTTYNIYVRANCGAEDGVGEWMSATATTDNLFICDDYLAADGSATSTYLPIYGMYCDAKQKTQMIYPASMLTALKGKTFSAMKFFVSSGSNAGKWDKATFNVRMGMTNEEIIPADYITGANTLVYSGYLTANATDGMQINFTTPFVYTGGNLLIEIELPSSTGYSAVTFLGETQSEERSIYGYSSSYSSPKTVQKFLPKVAFTSCVLGDACSTVDTIAHQLTGEGTTSALISWTASKSDYAHSYDLFYSESPVTDFSMIVPQFDSLTALSQEITGLEAYTDYYVYVRCNCDGEGQADGTSTWSAPYFFRTNSACRVVSNLKSTLLSKTSARVEWKASGQDNNFQYVLSTTPLSKAEVEVAPLTGSALVDTFVVLNGLQANQKYYVYVANSCGMEGVSPYVVDSFLTVHACPPVANLTANYVAFNAVGLTWNRGLFGEENQWEVGIVGRESKAQVVTDSSAVLIGLEAETDYTFYVKAICGDGDTSIVAKLAISTPVKPADEATIGAGTGSAYNMPFNTNYKNAWDQMIYSAASINRSGVITSISYNCASGYSLTDDHTRIYMGHTSMDVASSTTDWVAEADLTLVCDTTAMAHPTGAGWFVLPLKTPFEYNGTDNLVIVVSSQRSTYSSSVTYYYTFGAQGVTMYRQSDSDQSYASHPGSATGIQSSSLPNIKLGFEPASCAKVAQLTVENITTTSAKISWFPGGNETSWAIVNSTMALTDSALNAMVADTTSNLQVNLTGLTPDVDYHFYIRALCSDTIGGWKEVSYQTQPTCFAPINVVASEIEEQSAIISWSNQTEGFTGTYIVAYGLKDSLNIANTASYVLVENITDTFIAISGLNSNTAYEVIVKEACSATENSRWSQKVLFRTDCGKVTSFPWIEDFNAYTTTDKFVEPCWINKQIVEGTGTATLTGYCFRTYSSTVAKGSNATTLLQLPDMRSGEQTMLVLPQMSNTDGLQFSFDIYRESATTYPEEGIRVFYALNDTLDSTAVELGFVSRNYATADAAHGIAAESAYGWYTYTFDIPTTGNVYIILRGENRYGSSTFMDNFKVRLAPQCQKPIMTGVNTTMNSANLTWAGNAANYIVERSLNSNFSSVDTFMVADTMMTMSNLASGTTYFVRLTGVCEGDTKSDVSITTKFTTAFGLPFSENFNASSTSQPAGWQILDGDITDTALVATKGWTLSSSNGGGMTSIHEYSEAFSFSDKEYGYGDSITAFTLVSPEFYVNIDSGHNAELSFDLSLSAGSNNSTAPDSIACMGREFSVVVSEDGGQTWKAISSWSNTGAMGLYSSIPSSATTYTIDLTEYAGKSIMLGFYHTAGTTEPGTIEEEWDSYYYEYYYYINAVATYIHVDNVKVREVNHNCMGTNNLRANNVGAMGTTISWNYLSATKNAVIALSKDGALDLNNVVVLDTVLGDSTYVLPTLSLNTMYYAFVEQLCDSNETSTWEKISFSTPQGVRFEPIFTSATLPSDWTCFSGVVMGDTTRTSQLTKSSYGWSLVGADTLIGAYHFRSEIYSTWSYWLMTPTIDLTPNVGDGLILSFDAALVPYSASYAGKKATGVDDKFMVMISTDNGQTWTMSNATVWSNDSTGDYVLNDLLDNVKTYHLDLSSYAGKSIQIAFHQESSVSNTDNYIHVGNIVLDRVNAINYVGQTCLGSDYDGNGFHVASTDYVVGVNVFSKYYPSADSLSQDTLEILTLTVNEAASYSYTAQVCEGEHYQDANFTIDITRSTNPVQRKYLTASTGCDSIVTLNLTIGLTQKSDSFMEICDASYVMWGGKKIELPGNYEDTMVASTGCDSIRTLHLTMVHTLFNTRNMVLCDGESIHLSNGQVITTSGIYKDTIVTTAGCDSIVTWDVTAIPHLETAVTAIINQGETYNSEVFFDLAESGNYRGTMQSTHGCDSTVNLHLMVNQGQALYDTIALNALPYVVNGEELLGDTASAGSHVVTITVGISEVEIHVQIGKATAVDNVTANTLTLAPNPVVVGQETRVLNDFTPSQMRNLKLEVYSSTGALIYQATGANSTYVPAMNAAGIYMIRLSSGDDKYVAPLLVK